MRLCLIAVGITLATAGGCDRKATAPKATAGVAPSADSPTAAKAPQPPGAHVTGVRRVPGGEAVLGYTWIGGSEFLVFPDKQHVTAVRKNADSGEEVSLPGLTKRLRESLAKPDDVNLLTGVSADGKWLLWWPLGSKRFHAATLDGADSCSWERPGSFLEPRWLADGHRWVVSQETNIIFGTAEGATPNLLLFDPDVPGTAQAVKVVAKFADGEAAAATQKYSGFFSLGSTNNAPAQAKGFQYVIAGAVAVRRDFSVEVPEPLRKNAEAEVPKVSPDGERLLWLARPKGGKAVTFHISRLDGGGTEKVADYADPGGDRPKVEDPQWSSDGKWISFLADGFLYRFPAVGK
jgi:hypothetical protein